MQDSSIDRVKVFVIGVPLLRWGLEKLIESAHARYEITGSAVRMNDAIEMLRRQPACVAVLVSDAMAISELAQFCKLSPARAVLVTNRIDEAWLDQAVQAGVRAIVHTTDPPDVFLRALEKVIDGELWIQRSGAGRIFIDAAHPDDRTDPEQSRIRTLTLRERQTIAVVLGNAVAPGKVIAERLCMSEHTLRNHLTSIYSKLGVANRLDLYAYATRHALSDPDAHPWGPDAAGPAANQPRADGAMPLA